jgi:hypothetical protein
MGMCADIVALGPFSPDISQCLEYPPDLYRSTRSGATVVVTLFGITEGSSASRQFASCLGITDPWDFNQHTIDSSKIDVDASREFLQSISGGQEYARDFDKLLALRTRGFQFIFRPNG